MWYKTFILTRNKNHRRVNLRKNIVNHEQIVTKGFSMNFISIGIAEQHSKNRGKSNVQNNILFTFDVWKFYRRRIAASGREFTIAGEGIYDI